jgi:metal-responsive CopG/Arc/MetJ family transcriptional regulator
MKRRLVPHGRAGHTRSYPNYAAPMKVAVSIPDPLFEAAERLARSRRTTRSAIYAEALELLLTQHDSGDGITERLNGIYRDHDSALHPAVAASQAHVLREEW